MYTINPKSFLFPLLTFLLLISVIAGVWFWLSSGRLPGDPEVLGPGRLNNGTLDQQEGEPPPATYEDPEDPFTFTYPGRFIINQFYIEGNTGKRITVESTEAKKGFELTILPFDEPGPITPERIRRDLPDLPIDNLQYLIFTPLGQTEGIPALAFNSRDENIGPTYEIWFVRQGYLYQSITYPEFEGGMKDILATWEFK